MLEGLKAISCPLGPGVDPRPRGPQNSPYAMKSTFFKVKASNFIFKVFKDHLLNARGP